MFGYTGFATYRDKHISNRTPTATVSDGTTLDASCKICLVFFLIIVPLQNGDMRGGPDYQMVLSFGSSTLAESLSLFRRAPRRWRITRFASTESMTR